MRAVRDTGVEENALIRFRPNERGKRIKTFENADCAKVC